MRGKSGSAHFEMIISFVFFIGFVFFLFMFLSPEDTFTLSSSVIEGLHYSFEEMVYTNFSSVFLKANYTGANSCFYVDLPEEVFVYSITEGESFVMNLSGGAVGSDMESGELRVNNLDTFFRVVISPEFNNSNKSSCGNLTDFELGSIIERKVISYSELEAMVVRYHGDYDALKIDLGIPMIFDFAIVVDDLGISMEPVNGILGADNIVAKEFAAEVLKNNGELGNEKFNIRVWR